jgi:hypothetical protein
MACEAADGRECLADHIWALADRPVWAPRDAGTTAEEHLSISCWCPAAKHDGRKLQISVGKHKRVIWNCHAGCGELAVRHALIVGRRISARCLPVSAELSNDIFERLLAIGENGDLRHADARLLMVELLTSGKGRLPRGGDLDRLAARCHVSRSEAYKALGGNPRRPK